MSLRNALLYYVKLAGQFLLMSCDRSSKATEGFGTFNLLALIGLVCTLKNKSFNNIV